MIDFIYIAIIFSVLLLSLAFYIKNRPLGLMASMAIILVGVSILAIGLKGITNVLTISLGVIFVSMGAYVFIGGSLEDILTY